MADPSDCGFLCCAVVGAYKLHVGLGDGRGLLGRLGQASTGALPLPAQKVALRLVSGLRVVVLEALGAMMLFSGVVIFVQGGTTRDQQACGSKTEPISYKINSTSRRFHNGKQVFPLK